VKLGSVLGKVFSSGLRKGLLKNFPDFSGSFFKVITIESVRFLVHQILNDGCISFEGFVRTLKILDESTDLNFGSSLT
jgi:hypothetical protein